MIEPVSYQAVGGVGFYRHFLTTRDWAGFMEAGRVRAVTTTVGLFTG